MKRVSLLILFFAPLLIFAQHELYNGGASIYVQPGALVHVQGDFINDVNSTYKNDGILEVDGDFENNSNAVFNFDSLVSSTDRAVKFTGTGKQHIIGNFNKWDTQSIYNLVMNQQTTSDTVEMQANALVQGSLVFGSGVTTTTYNPSSPWTTNANTGLLKTFANNSDPAQRYLLSVENGDIDAIAGYPSLVINGAPTTGFVLTQGTIGDTLSSFTGLQRKITSTSAYVYPVGTIAHSYNALRVNFTSLTGGSGQDVVAQFSDSTTNASGYEGNLSQYCSGCSGHPQSLSPDNNGFNYFFSSNPCYGYGEWIILEQTTKDHGFWSMNSTTTGSNYQYWVEAFPNSFVSNRSPFGVWRVLKYSAGGTALNDYYYNPTSNDWTSQILSSISSPNDLLTYTSYTDCYTGSGVPGGLYTGFSQFGMFGENSNDALPIDLLSLAAQAFDNQYINISWSTATEVNNAGFTVLRSTDGINFDSVQWVAGIGNSTSPQSYYYNDYTALPGVVYYYRLYQYDINGGEIPSTIVSANLDAVNNFAISNFIPNPAASGAQLIITASTDQNVTVELFNILGQKISSAKYPITHGAGNKIEFNLQNLSAGTYTAVIQADAGIFTKRLEVSK